MVRLYKVHCCALAFQCAAFLLCLVVGAVLVSKSYFLSAANEVKSAVRADPSVPAGSDLKAARRGEEAALDAAYWRTRAVGVLSLCVAALVLAHAAGDAALALGPGSGLVRRCPCASAHRDRMEAELLELMRRDGEDRGHLRGRPLRSSLIDTGGRVDGPGERRSGRISGEKKKKRRRRRRRRIRRLSSRTSKSSLTQ